MAVSVQRVPERSLLTFSSPAAALKGTREGQCIGLHLNEMPVELY
jgi:hypothetical protein